MKRLIKKAKWWSSGKIGSGVIEVFKNPTLKEVHQAGTMSNSIRGIIANNGDVYVWDGSAMRHALCYS